MKRDRSLRKLLPLFLLLVFAVSIYSGKLTARAQATVITTPAQLAAMTADGEYELGGNITVDGSTWVPVSNFTGSLNGAGHTITWSGTSASQRGTVTSSNFGIIGTVGSTGTITNLTIAGNLYVTGSNMDYISTLAGYNNGTINGVTNNAVLDAASTCFNVGGLAGFNTGFILNSHNSGAVTGYHKVGGVVGENAGTINSCYNAATITGLNNTTKNGVGGIAGRNGNNNVAVETGKIWNCRNSGNITCSNGKWVGGIAGFQNTLSSCVNCLNSGTFEALSYVDDTVGRNEGLISNCYGKSTDSAQHIDGTSQKSDIELKNDAITAAIGIGADNRWTREDGVNDSYPYPSGNATTTDSDPTAAGSFTIAIIRNPKLEYLPGETFTLAGFDLRAVYVGGATTSITNYTSSIAAGTVLNANTRLTISGSYTDTATNTTKTYNFTYNITVSSDAESGIFVDGSYGLDTNAGISRAVPVKTLARAVELAADNSTIYAMRQVNIDTNYSDTAAANRNLTVKRSKTFTGTMIRCNGAASVTFSNLTFDGNRSVVPNANGFLVSSEGTGDLYISGAVIQNNASAGVNTDWQARLTMSSGTIQNCAKGMYLDGAGTMSGGTITNCDMAAYCSDDSLTIAPATGSVFNIASPIYLTSGRVLPITGTLANITGIINITSDVTTPGTIIAVCGSGDLASGNSVKVNYNGVAVSVSGNNLLIP